MEIVFRALSDCSLSDVDKMEKAVDFGLRDDYDLCYGLKDFWKRNFSKKDWSSLADRLLGRLDDTAHSSREDEFYRDYRRDHLLDEIIHALENARRQKEVIPLCMKEADATRSYKRLVEQLRKAGRTEEAEEWIRKGITAIKNKWPGISSSLKEELLNIRSIKKDWLFVAALRADDFFDQPALRAYEDLQKASEKAKVWPKVRESVLHFLETGKTDGKGDGQWPLPDTGLEKSERSRYDKPPFTSVLIEIAIHEKRLKDVLKWYDFSETRQKNSVGDHLRDNVATAIAGEYPDRAVEIWKALAEKQISITNVSAYSVGAAYLRKAQKVMARHGRADKWDVYVQRLKEANRRKPRLIQILGSLSEKPIVRSKSER